MTPPFHFWFSKGDLMMIAYAKLIGFLSVGYFSIFMFQMSLSPCQTLYYGFNNSIYTSQIFRTKIKIILYLLQSHLTQLDHLYQTPSPKPGCRTLYTCQYTWVHLHPSSTEIILYLLQSHLTQLDHLYQTPSPKPGCRTLYTCQYTWVHLHPSSTDTIAWHQVQYCFWS